MGAVKHLECSVASASGSYRAAELGFGYDRFSERKGNPPSGQTATAFLLLDDDLLRGSLLILHLLLLNTTISHVRPSSYSSQIRSLVPSSADPVTYRRTLLVVSLRLLRGVTAIAR